MASDLSELIQNGLSGTLESLLAKTSTLKQTNKTNKDDLKGQCVRVNSIFEFTDITSKWSFFIPAYGASHIFNLMMGEDIEPSEEVDDDIVDALNEVVSNICGGLSTAINGSGFEDLGGVKFSLDGNEIVDGKDHAETENLYKFTISLEEREVVIFIAFDELIMPYIDVISSSEMSETKSDDTEEESPEENKEDESEEADSDNPEENVEDDTDTASNDDEEVNEDEPSSDDSTEDAKEETSEDGEKEETTEENKDDESAKENDKEEESDTSEKPSIKEKLKLLLSFLKVDESLSPEEQKQAKLKKIIILVGAIFGVVILVGAILFFAGAFDPEVVEEKTVKDINTTNTPTKVTIKSTPRKKKINFKTSQINVKRLNKKLSLLTKYEILEEDAIEKIKAKEKERLYKEKRARLEEFAKLNKEEALFKKGNGLKEVIHKNEYTIQGVESENNTTTVTKNEAEKVITKLVHSYIQIPPLKLKKFQPFIKKTRKLNANLSICKDTNGRKLIFVGPFSSETSRDSSFSSLNKNLRSEAKKLNLSQEEFEEKCSF